MQKENVHPQNNITKKEIKDNVIYSVEGHGNVVPNANLSCHSSVSSFLCPYSSSTIFLVSPLIQVYVCLPNHKFLWSVPEYKLQKNVYFCCSKEILVIIVKELVW